MDTCSETLSERRIAKLTLEIDLVKDSATEDKIFVEAYEYQTNRTNNRRSLDEILAQEARHELAQKLLFETIYMAALAQYYKDLYYYQSGLGLSPYPEQYPEYYLGPYQPHPESKSFAPPARKLGHHLGHSSKHLLSNFFMPSVAKSAESSPHCSLAHNLISTARHNLGRPVWAFSKFASFCQLGYLGCAATVSELLNVAGFKIKGAANVAGVVNELSTLGWHKIKIYDKHQFRAGDIVYGLKGNHAHIGIITAADQDKVLVCDNSSSSGTLKERTLESGGSFTPNGRFAGSLYVMRAGDTKSNKISYKNKTAIPLTLF